jgi:phosphoribosylaminoimidazolecarboxamide formyltransferase/IMP cyclohydrolase
LAAASSIEAGIRRLDPITIRRHRLGKGISIMERITIRRALISVSDKTGIVDFARKLAGHGVELLSTGGTYRAIHDANLPVTEVADYTQFPEMMDGRVKTLHPKVHGGLLYRRDLPAHESAAREHGIKPIDMVVVNLYPFEATVAQPGATRAEAIENIDIGGPSMIRSAAKNHAAVAVVTDPAQYAEVASELEAHAGSLPASLLERLAVAAFARTADYDRAIHRYLSGSGADEDPDFPAKISLHFDRAEVLRYGENPHQKGAFYVDATYRPASLARARQRHGKELSYNNLLDLDSALAIVREFRRPAVSIIKHNNPCGAAVADRLVDAYSRAHAGDPQSAFGGIVGVNIAVDEETAIALTEPDLFFEAVIAPAFSEEAVRILTTRPSWKNSVRLLEVGDVHAFDEDRQRGMLSRPIEGGLLRQSADLGASGWEDRQVVTRRAPTESELRDLSFAWTMVKHVRSNAIVIAKNESLIGVGAGQMSRVDAVQIACKKAGDRVQDSTLASDAFFPFRDNVDTAASSGVTAIVQPGGSKRDQESIDACDEFGIAMLLTGRRHFKH